MPEEAKSELFHVNAVLAGEPIVIYLRLQIHAALREWTEMQSLAQNRSAIEPETIQWRISWAYATRRTESIAAAKEILMEAIKLHPGEAVLHYNLACYECQMGKLDAANTRLREAVRLERTYREMARDDEDLKLLWPLIGTIPGL